MKHKIFRFVFALLAVSLLFNLPRAQQPLAANQQSSEDRVALYQALLDLQNPWTVMCVAAHPDDEDGTSLVVMRHKYGAHTVSLFSTFGEGGQNAIGPELYEELGAIRARETMAAAEIQGSEPHFLGLKDFGYSKTRDEAFRFWGHEEALRRMVLEIRKLRPDVIITNHSTTSNDHGQHQATALMVVEAFDAAADPNKFPEQLKDGVTTWQVQRLFVRARGNQASTPDAQIVTIDPNEKDPVRGVVYAEEALRALQQHATQGPWPKSFAEYANRFRAFSGQQAGTAGQLPMIRYALVKSAKSVSALPQDSHNFLDGLRLPADVAAALSTATIEAKPLTDFVKEPARVAEALLTVYGQMSAAGPRMLLAREKAARALAVAANIHFTIDSKDHVLVPGMPTEFVVELANHGPFSVRPDSVSFSVEGEKEHAPFRSSRTLGDNQSAVTTVNHSASANALISIPHARHLYDGRWRGERVEAETTFEINGKRVTLATVLFMDIAPHIDIESISPSPIVITPSTANRPITLTANVTNHRNSVDGVLSVQDQRISTHLPALSSKSIRIALTRGLPKHTQELRFALTGSPAVTSSVPLVFADAQVATNLSIGYIRGFDFSLPNALNALGVESKELSVDEVKTADLSKFTSVIVDNRVYESKPQLIAVNQKLLDYANAGGNLIVFYHKSDEWNPDERRNRPQLAPYKLILGNERITDENAPITFIEPDHPLLNMPNKLNQDDFKDWIQERGLYYPKEWDPKFHALLESNDPGEAPLKGGLLVADYGRGHYIYTSMVWYRELRGGIPGAYRMLANMISYGRTR